MIWLDSTSRNLNLLGHGTCREQPPPCWKGNNSTFTFARGVGLINNYSYPVICIYFYNRNQNWVWHNRYYAGESFIWNAILVYFLTYHTNTFSLICIRFMHLCQKVHLFDKSLSFSSLIHCCLPLLHVTVPPPCKTRHRVGEHRIQRYLLLSLPLICFNNFLKESYLFAKRISNRINVHISPWFLPTLWRHPDKQLTLEKYHPNKISCRLPYFVTTPQNTPLLHLFRVSVPKEQCAVLVKRVWESTSKCGRAKTYTYRHELCGNHYFNCELVSLILNRNLYFYHANSAIASYMGRFTKYWNFKCHVCNAIWKFECIWANQMNQMNDFLQRSYKGKKNLGLYLIGTEPVKSPPPTEQPENKVTCPPC